MTMKNIRVLTGVSFCTVIGASFIKLFIQSIVFQALAKVKLFISKHEAAVK